MVHVFQCVHNCTEFSDFFFIFSKDKKIRISLNKNPDLKEPGLRSVSKMVQKHDIPIGNTEGNCPSLSIKVIVLHRYFELSVQMNVSPIANTMSCFLIIGMVFDSVCDVYNAPGGRNQNDFFFVIKKIIPDGSKTWLFNS